MYFACDKDMNLGKQRIECYELRLCLPLNLPVEILTPETSQYDLVWRQGLYRDNQIKVRSLGGPPDPMSPNPT